MEFRDLKKQYSVLKDQIDSAILSTVASGTFILGAPVKELEKELADYVGTKHCITCANGTDALSLALMAWGIGPGDAIFVPDFTFFASAEVVSFAGATPIFVDVDPDTFNIDAAALEDAVKTVLAQGQLKPAVVIPVDLFGLPADYKAIQKIADKYGIYVLEDSAQGFGGSIAGKKSCSFGDIATTSFFPAKPLGCYGDGGAIFTDDDALADLIVSLRFHGKGSDKYDNVRIGVNSRLDTIQAAILRVKLNAFKEYEVSKVNRAASLYSALLKDIVKVPVVPDEYHSSWAQYTILLRDRVERDAMQMNLKENGIPTMVYYPKPMHAQTAFSYLRDEQSTFPNTQMLCDRVLSLPMHPYLADNDIERICGSIQVNLVNLRGV